MTSRQIYRLLTLFAFGLATPVFAPAEAPQEQQTETATEEAAPGEVKEYPYTLVGAGDIANCKVGNGHIKTAQVLDDIPGIVFTTGDNAYPKGTVENFEECYESSWGRHKARTRPSPGNHDLLTKKGAPYYDYFGENAGPKGRGYYSYTLGSWHIISLNSDAPADRRSRQMQWLWQELEANQSKCILAYWHIPVFSSGSHGGDPKMVEVWRLLSRYGADVIVNGHDHVYERFAPQNSAGKADAERGIRQFTVGVGGAGVYPFKRVLKNSEARTAKAYGVIKFTLHEDSYDWEFVYAAGDAFEDKGSASCRS
jgi:3',5'-cyclic AMP phosphodiesterase CpdA